jgi:mutator protein MutT
LSLRLGQKIQTLSRRAYLSERRLIHVLAGVLIDASDRVLLAERPLDKHQAGRWEFPGGKIETGESRLSALQRELREELGVDVRTARPLHLIRHAYPDRDVLLDVWRVETWDGECRGAEGQNLLWCVRHDLNKVDILPADRPVVTLLRVGERIDLNAAEPAYRIEWAKRWDGTPAADCLIGVMCEDSLDVLRAAQLGADFIVLRIALSAVAMADLQQQTNLPIYYIEASHSGEPILAVLQIHDLRHYSDG